MIKLSVEDAYFYKLIYEAGFDDDVNNWIYDIANNNELLEDIYLDLVSSLGDKHSLISCLHNYICEKEVDKEVLALKLRLFIKDKYDKKLVTKEEVVAFFCNVSVYEFIDNPVFNTFYLIESYYDLVDNVIYNDKFYKLVLDFLDTGKNIDPDEFWEKRKKLNISNIIKEEKELMSPIRFKVNYVITPIIAGIMFTLITIIAILLSINEKKYTLVSMILFGVFWILFASIFILIAIVREKEILYEIDYYDFNINDNIENFEINYQDKEKCMFTKDGFIIDNKLYKYDDFIIEFNTGILECRIKLYIDFLRVYNTVKLKTYSFELSNIMLNAIFKFNIKLCNKEKFLYVINNKEKAFKELKKYGYIQNRFNLNTDIDIIKANECSSGNIKELKESNICGCFYCIKIFEKDKIKDYLENEDTALCPFCGIDSVIGDKSGYPITKEFLSKMNAFWFD